MQSRVTQRPRRTSSNLPHPPSLITYSQAAEAAAALDRNRDRDTPSRRRESGESEHRERRVQAYPLGTVEDVQRDDYESPIDAMFFRAWDRYRTAEEVRRAEAQSMAFQARNNENIPPQQRNPLNASSFQHNVSTSPPNLNPLASPFNPPRPSPVTAAGFHEPELGSTPGPARLRGIPHRPRASFHTPFYFGHAPQIPSLPRHEPDPMDDRPNPIDAQSQQRPVPSQPESLTVDFACKVCIEQKINTFCEPCMHACMCQWCAAIVRDECRSEGGRFDGRLWRCPICRARITQVRKFYVE